MSDLKLVIFDVDGTLVDSQRDIIGSMRDAFDRVELAPPADAAILGIVGLSLPQAMARLRPDASAEKIDALVAAYKTAYATRRRDTGSAESSPLFPGIADMLERLQARPEILLGVATGKSRRGLNLLMEAHDLRRFFVTMQTADDHPSKPHPSMILTALSETGLTPQDAVMVGDASFDMEMARAAGVRGIGVSWGFQPRAVLERHATVIADDVPALQKAIHDSLGVE